MVKKHPDRHVVRVPLSGLPGGNTHVSIEVYYSKGGANVWSGGSNRRGYWFSATPIEVTDGGYRMQISLGRDSIGGRLLLQEVPRLNARQLMLIAGAFLPCAQELAEIVVSDDKQALIQRCQAIVATVNDPLTKALTKKFEATPA